VKEEIDGIEIEELSIGYSEGRWAIAIYRLMLGWQIDKRDREISHDQGTPLYIELAALQP
jgi:hypothetical protein